MAISKDFSEILSDFFSKHDKRYKRKVAKLAVMFEGKEDEVLLELCRKYNVSPRSIDGFEVNDDVAAKFEPTEIPDPEIPSGDHQAYESNDDTGHESNDATDEASEDLDVPAKKGGKKKMIIALVVLLLAGVGAGGGAYFMGVFGGSDSSESAQEQVAEIETESSETMISDSTETESIADSLGTDSTNVSSTEAADTDSAGKEAKE